MTGLITKQQYRALKIRAFAKGAGVFMAIVAPFIAESVVVFVVCSRVTGIAIPSVAYTLLYLFTGLSVVLSLAVGLFESQTF